MVAKRGACPRELSSVTAWGATAGNVLTRLMRWQGKIKCGAVIYLALSPDSTAVAIDNALGGRQTNASPGKLAGGMQPLEHAKQTTRVIHVEPRSIVPYKKCGRRILGHAHFNFGVRLFA